MVARVYSAHCLGWTDTNLTVMYNHVLIFCSVTMHWFPSCTEIQYNPLSYPLRVHTKWLVACAPTRGALALAS